MWTRGTGLQFKQKSALPQLLKIQQTMGSQMLHNIMQILKEIPEQPHIQEGMDLDYELHCVL